MDAAGRPAVAGRLGPNTEEERASRPSARVEPEPCLPGAVTALVPKLLTAKTVALVIPSTCRARPGADTPTVAPPGGRVTIGPEPRGHPSLGPRVTRTGPLQDAAAARADVTNVLTAPGHLSGAVDIPLSSPFISCAHYPFPAL